MNKFLKILDKVLSVYCYSMMGILAVSIILSVFLRYVFNITFVKGEEAITMVFVATTFYGAALGIRERDHISIAYFSEKANDRMRGYIDILVNLVIIFVLYYLFKNSLVWIDKVGNVKSPGLQVATKYLYVMVPISCVLSIFYCIINILSVFISIDEPEYGYDRNEIHLEEAEVLGEEIGFSKKEVKS
ncbi:MULTISPECIES: TRAP transporter small permease [unclassified Oceanispirochaeta]|uniref:TRAP transporter small permease n=1 Tax=unclassified Oceanispirochaeta TaxID=2635722 RepID=UPI000E08EBC2|nr:MULTISPECIES: TRAP transporter small permease [unclassified Oceanispirochaeta]MBF9018875.1 TRAP transporter small permease [Oceanispirochaeta sp. M2]NPD75363.1 TRAP transporter small permease [Oceanispirochaeta sp. M1]RDG28791.1 TRAP transporter small permease [Oceanispirochaeta sp. M1]